MSQAPFKSCRCKKSYLAAQCGLLPPAWPAHFHMQCTAKCHHGHAGRGRSCPNTGLLPVAHPHSSHATSSLTVCESHPVISTSIFCLSFCVKKLATWLFMKSLLSYYFQCNTFENCLFKWMTIWLSIIVLKKLFPTFSRLAIDYKAIKHSKQLKWICYHHHHHHILSLMWEVKQHIPGIEIIIHQNLLCLLQ